MNHEAFENEMFNSVNRHSGELDHVTFDHEIPDTVKSNPAKNETLKTIGRGLYRMIMALCTAGLFAFSVLDFILVTKETGYGAVLMFFAGILMLFAAIGALYVQGIVGKESQGDGK